MLRFNHSYHLTKNLAVTSTIWMGDQSSVEVNDVVKILKNLRSGEMGPPKHAPACTISTKSEKFPNIFGSS